MRNDIINCKTCRSMHTCDYDRIRKCRFNNYAYWVPATSAQLLERTLGSPRPNLKGNIDTGYIYGTPEITKVIFNGPATIAFWSDGVKTVAKCDSDDIFDPEKGIMMCITKRFFGDNYTYNSVIGKWIPEDSASITDKTCVSVVQVANRLLKIFGN